MANIISLCNWNEETRRVTLAVNPYFHDVFGRGRYTLLDLELRNNLKSPVAKGLFRFTQSHRDDKWQGNFMTLAASLNLRLDQYRHEIKKRIKGAIKEMIANDMLTGKSRLEGDMVQLFRQGRRPRRKLE